MIIITTIYAIIKIYKWVKYLSEYKSLIILTGKFIIINIDPPTYLTVDSYDSPTPHATNTYQIN